MVRIVVAYCMVFLFTFGCASKKKDPYEYQIKKGDLQNRSDATFDELKKEKTD